MQLWPLQPQQSKRLTNLVFHTMRKLLFAASIRSSSWLFICLSVCALCVCLCVSFIFQALNSGTRCSRCYHCRRNRRCGCHILKKKLCDSLYLLEDSLCLQLNHRHNKTFSFLPRYFTYFSFASFSVLVGVVVVVVVVVFGSTVGARLFFLTDICRY